ncbi:nuclear transport factor 2 family protein [Streptomyces sp. NPDC048275]|uniref:nuclear transport factor 2 family protein n=1 Tax=Streptomyces sp. NPDC048275 TaxID=3155629 RepID=UPI0033EDF8AF
MSWKRGLLAALAVGALLGGPAGCGTGEAPERTDETSASPVGKLLDETDERGRHYREVEEKGAPEVAIEVQPDSDADWDVRLTVRNFHFSPSGTKAAAVAGRGLALLSLDGRTIATLRTTRHHLPADLVPRGTHQVTARLYADDRTAWAVHGKPVESTADITASAAGPTPTPPAETETATPTTSGSGTASRTDTGGSRDPGGKAS